MPTTLQKLTRKCKVWSRIAVGIAQNPFSLSTSISDVQFLSDVATIRHLHESGKGIVRFGDGELNFIAGYPAIHQHQDPNLRARLTEILREYDGTQPYLLALPLDLLLTGNFEERSSPRENWRAPKYIALPYIKKNVLYGSALCFRIRKFIESDKHAHITKLIELFHDHRIVYVRGIKGDTTRINPDVTITIPERDAFEEYDAIRTRILEAAGDDPRTIVLLSAGVTATALAAELNNQGIRAYDVGSLFTQLETT